MLVDQILFEHFVNLFSPEQKEKYKDIVWDILQTSYANKGGFKSAASADELVHTPGLWKLSRRNDKIVSVAIYKDRLGRKAIAFGTDQSDGGKKDFFNLANADLKFDRMWTEASGRIESALIRSGAKMIPSKYASILTGKEILKYNPDGHHYTRLIQGTPEEKAMFGFVQLDQDTVNQFVAAGISLHDLPNNLKINLST